MRLDYLYQPAIAETIDKLRTGRISRRETLRLLGGAGLATTGLLALGRRAAFAQEGGTPAPVATPQIGPRADGSTLWRVQVAEMNMEEHTDFHAFFPEEISITEGDAIWFDFGMTGFHTVSFLSGAEVPPLFIPDPELGTPVPEVAGGTPAAGGPPKLIVHPDIVLPQGGDSYDGTGYVNSGIDVFRDPSQPYVLTFTASGTYDYLCIIHGSVMKARVVVQATGAALPHTQAEYDQMTADKIATFQDQAKAEVETYAQATSTENTDGATTWEATAGAGGDSQVRIQSFLPTELEVMVGDTVTWVHRAVGEPHTISFLGAGETPPEDLIVEQFADGRPKFVQNMQTLLPQGGNVWSGTGWVHSGFMGIPDLGMPMEFALTFDTPGEYTYFCLLHGNAQGENMSATITVNPKG